MEKLGYVILISIYFISFSIGKSFINNEETFSRLESVSNKYRLESIAKDMSNAIGMDDFFYYINKGI